LQVTAAEDAELELFVASLSATALQLPLRLSPGGAVPLDPVVPLLVGGTVTPGTVVPLFAGASTVTDSHNPVSGLRICSGIV
jgi:hypothetical protein